MFFTLTNPRVQRSLDLIPLYAAAARVPVPMSVLTPATKAVLSVCTVAPVAAPSVVVPANPFTVDA